MIYMGKSFIKNIAIFYKKKRRRRRRIVFGSMVTLKVIICKWNQTHHKISHKTSNGVWSWYKVDKACLFMLHITVYKKCFAGIIKKAGKKTKEFKMIRPWIKHDEKYV